MAAIYDKALKRKDLSGITNKDRAGGDKDTKDAAATPKVATKEDKAKAKTDKQKADDPKPGAGSQLTTYLLFCLQLKYTDIGKIVNLMSNDAEDVSNIASVSCFYFPRRLTNINGAKTLYFLYGAPFEVVIGSVFLYQLLVSHKSFLVCSYC
jgi:hypothetical protein